MDMCSEVLTDSGFGVEPAFTSHPTSPVVTSPTMDTGYPWYSNIQTMWARKNVEMTKDKPFKRWFEGEWKRRIFNHVLSLSRSKSEVLDLRPTRTKTCQVQLQASVGA